MDPIKEAFSKIKSDIQSLHEELNSLRNEIQSLNFQLSSLKSTPTIPTQTPKIPTIPTNQQTNKPTQNLQKVALEDLPSSNFQSSIGNEGVPTNKPTNQQTNTQTQKEEFSSHNPTILSPLSKDNFLIASSDFKRANEILGSLDLIKKEIRLKFKRLTPQEMLIFSTLYLLEEEGSKETTYKLLATRLSLSESSIRDYTNKLINKGIPLEKKRQNNKTIVLSISLDLKNVATLETIQRLREI